MSDRCGKQITTGEGSEWVTMRQPEDPTLIAHNRVHWKVAIFNNGRDPVAHWITAWRYAKGCKRNHIEAVRTKCSSGYRRVRWVLPTKWAAQFARPCRKCWRNRILVAASSEPTPVSDRPGYPR